MATKSKHSTASVLPTNEAIWSGRKLTVPKAPKVKHPREQTRKGVPFRKGAKRK